METEIYNLKTHQVEFGIAGKLEYPNASQLRLQNLNSFQPIIVSMVNKTIKKILSRFLT